MPCITYVIATTDKTAAVVSGVANNGIYSIDKKITFNEGTATLDGATFTTGTTASSEGKHTLVVTDLAGKITTISFIIDKSKPAITAKTSKKVIVKNGGYSATSVTVSDSDIFSVTTSDTLNGKAYSWPKGGIFSKVGTYVITVKDQYSNSSKTTFTIDETAPKIVVKSVSGGKTVTIIETNLSSKTVKLNGKTIAWASGNKFTKKGAYVIIVTDKACNRTTSKFSI